VAKRAVEVEVVEQELESKGISKMWQGILQKNYASFEEFEVYARNYRLHERLGFKTIKGAWRSNPMVQGSVNPEDFKRVKKPVAIRKKKR
jgi:hypothetical protein